MHKKKLSFNNNLSFHESSRDEVKTNNSKCNTNWTMGKRDALISLLNSEKALGLQSSRTKTSVEDPEERDDTTNSDDF